MKAQTRSWNIIFFPRNVFAMQPKHFLENRVVLTESKN